MDRYFFKVIDNIDFVWKIEENTKDPYKGNEIEFTLSVCNERQFVPYLFRTIHDIKNKGLLNDYEEITPGVLTDEKYYYDKTIGLLHKDSYRNTLFAVRYINCLGITAQVVFREEIQLKDIAVYSKLISCNKNVGDAIYETAYNYFKSLWEIDEYFSSTNLDTMEKFLVTLQLLPVHIRENDGIKENLILFHFRPSWDEEHGLRISLDVETNEVELIQ